MSLSEKLQLSVRVMTPPGSPAVSIPEARNTIVREAKTNWVVLLDDCDVPRPDFIEVMRRAAIVGAADLVTSYSSIVEVRPSQVEVEENRVKIPHLSLAGGDSGPATNFFAQRSDK